MGKTRRFDPESVDIRPSKKTAGKHGTFTRKKEQPEVITEEWAFKSMKRHIDFLMGKLVTADLVERGEEDFYIDLFKADIGKAVREYDPEKKNEEGRTASALHYLSAVVDNRYRFILRYLGQLCRKGVRVPISTLPPEEAVKYGYVAEESLSDECRNVNEMIFKMDLRTLVGLMTEIEATAFKMLMEGETQCCVERTMGIASGTFRRKVLSEIQRKCRECGFVPRRSARLMVCFLLLMASIFRVMVCVAAPIIHDFLDAVGVFILRRRPPPWGWRGLSFFFFDSNGLPLFFADPLDITISHCRLKK